MNHIYVLESGDATVLPVVGDGVDLARLLVDRDGGDDAQVRPREEFVAFGLQNLQMFL